METLTKLTRYLLFIGVIIFLALVVLPVFITRQGAFENLKAQEQQTNLTVSRSLTHAYWSELTHLLAVDEHEAAGVSGHVDGSVLDVSGLSQALEELLAESSVVKVNIFNRDGATVHSTDASAVGEKEVTNPRLIAALTGEISREFEPYSLAGESKEIQVLSVYLPIYYNPDQHEAAGQHETAGPHEETQQTASHDEAAHTNGEVIGVFELYSNVTPQIQSINRAQLGTALSSAGLLLLIYGSSFWFLRKATKTVSDKQQQLERYALLVQQTPTILLEATRAGQFLYLNPSAKRHFPELDRTEIVTAHPLLTAWESVTNNLQEGATFERELSISDKVYMQKISRNEKSQNYDMYIYDVTQQKRSEAELLKAQREQRGILDAIPDMVFVMDKSGTYLDFKLDKTHQLIETLVGRNVKDLGFMSAEVAQAITEKLQLAVSTGQTHLLEYSLEGNIENERRFAHYEARFAPVDTEKVLMVVRDVSKRHQDEVALQTLTHEAQRHAGELLLLDKVRSVAVQELEFEQVTSKTVDVIAATFHYSLVSIYLLEGDELVLQHQVGYPDPIARLPVARGVMGRVARTGLATLVTDRDHDPDAVWAFEGINSEICVPLLDSGRVVGVLNFESTGTHFLDEDDFRLVTALSDTLGVAIERARLYQETKASEHRFRDLYRISQQQAQDLSRQTGELELLEQVRTLIGNKTELGVLYKTVTEVVAGLLGYELVAISLVDGNTLVMQHQVGYTKPITNEPGDLGVEGRVIRSAKAELVSDVKQDPEYLEVEPGTQSEVCVPLFLGGKVTGVLIVESVHKTLEEADLRLLERLGAYVSLAMEQAQLYGEIKASEATFRSLYTVTQEQTEQLEQRASELELLEQIRTMIASKLEPTSLFKSVTEAVSRVLDHPFVSIALVKGDTLEIQHHIGYEKVAETIKPTLSLAKGVIGRVARTGQSALVLDVKADPDYYLGPDSQVISELCVPLHHQGAVVGVLNVESDKEVLTEAQLETLTKVASYLSLALDQAELYQELQHSETRYRELIENAGDIIYRIDTRGQFTYMNSVITKVLGYEGDEMVGKVYLELIRPDYHAEARAFYSKQLREGIMTTYLEFPALHKAGTEVWLGQNVQLVFEEGKLIGCQAVARDITERKRMEEALVQQAEELSSANADLEQFAFIAAHDLQEPLRKIQAFGDRLNLKYKDALDEQGRDYLARMRSSATRMRTLIDDLLSFARANKQQKRETVSLETVIKGVLNDLQVRIEETEATISVGGLPTLEVDPSQFRQVFQNLLSNALKFRKPDTHPVITVYGHRLPSGEWEIRVSDNGIGFEEQYKERVFAVFQRLHSREQYEGTGIGLAIVRRILESHGGGIEVSSTPGEGTTFFITLPGVAKIHTEEPPETVLA